MADPTLPTGIRRRPSGWYQVRIRISGELKAKGFPPDTPLADMIRWRQERYARALLGQPADDDADGPSFASDCRRYLASVKSMPSYRDRERHILDWQAALGGGKPRCAITPVAIRRVVDGWRRRTKRPLSGASCNRRLTSLQALWTTLDGRHAPNPVKDVLRYPEPVKALQLPTLDEAERVIAHVGANAAGTAHPKKGRRSRARLQVLLWTGWPPAQLKRMTRTDVDFTQAVAYLPARQKGRGARGRRLPLLPQAVAALRALDEADGWGVFAVPALLHVLHGACDRAGVRRFRIYDLRHLFLTMVASAAKDDRAVAELGLHTSPSQTRRYTTGSVDGRMRAALDAVARATFAGQMPQNTADRDGPASSRKF